MMIIAGQPRRERADAPTGARRNTLSGVPFTCRLRPVSLHACRLKGSSSSEEEEAPEQSKVSTRILGRRTAPFPTVPYS